MIAVSVAVAAWTAWGEGVDENLILYVSGYNVKCWSDMTQ